MVYATLRQAASVAHIEDQSRLRDLYQVQTGKSCQLEFIRNEAKSVQQLLSNIDRVAKSHHEGKDSKTVFDEIFDSKLSEEDKKPLRLLQEAQNFSIAGTETTSWILSVRRTRTGASPFHES